MAKISFKKAVEKPVEKASSKSEKKSLSQPAKPIKTVVNKPAPKKVEPIEVLEEEVVDSSEDAVG